MSTILENLQARIRPGSQALRHTVDQVMGVAGVVASHKERLAKNTHMSDEGRKAALAGIVKDSLARDLAQVTVQSGAGGLEARRAKLRPARDKTDMVGEMRQAEARSYLRNLPNPGERRATAATMMADPEIAQAVLGAHPSLSGLAQADVDLLKARHDEETHGQELKAIEAEASDLEAVGAAISISTKDLQMASGLSGPAFDELMAALEK